MDDATLRVGVIGAAGRMGSMVCEAVAAAADMELAARICHGDPLSGIVDAGCRVVVDFTRPDAVMDHISFAVGNGIHIIAGTSGFDAGRLAEVEALCAGVPGVGVMVVPNFAIGAVLALRFARLAAPFFDGAEIIELHHAGKVDAPSGTAVAAAAGIAAARAAAGSGPAPDVTITDPGGARGADVDGVHVHAVRLPGLVAHMEMLFGSPGETLTIRHDSLSRESFMPGVLAAIRAVPARPGLTVGLDVLLDG